jgi:uncharacterized repeat protein (TIGR01451 family)
MVDVLVAEISDGAALVVPAQLIANFLDPQVIGFTVTNEGNTSQDYALTASNLGDGANVPFSTALTDSDSATSDATSITMFVDDDGSNTFNGADVVVTFLDAMTADETRTVWVVADIPAGAVNGAVIGVSLQATTHDSVAPGLDGLTAETVLGSETLGGVDVLFADDFPLVFSTDDGATDGMASDRDAFLVSAAVLTIVKASTIISDPFGGAVTLAVPGAIVEYTVTVTNIGTATATSVSISDDLSVEIGNGTVAFTPDQYSGTDDIRLVINGGPPTDLTEAPDLDQGEFVGNVVTVDSVTLTPGDVAVVSFRITIL